MRTKLKDRVLPTYTKGEEIFNMVTHIVGGGLSIIALVLCIVGLSVVGFPIKALIDKVTGIYRTQYFSESKEIADIVVENTDENDKIAVFGNNDIIYLLSDRMSSTKFSYQNPVTAIDLDAREEFIKEMEKLDTEIIVTNPESIIKSFVEELITDHYTLINTVGELDIYKKT